MRATDDAMFDAMVFRIGGQIQGPMELMRLYADKGYECDDSRFLAQQT